MTEGQSSYFERQPETRKGNYADGTVKYKIVTHLYALSERVVVAEEHSQLPRRVCQDGIAESVGISRAHASLRLIDLEDEGVVGAKLGHVDGYKRRKKVYYLTGVGER